MVDFSVTPAVRRTPDERAALLADPGFGRVFTDHMVTVRGHVDQGWSDARLDPFGPLALSPATAALHYGQEIFEGMKAYAVGDDRVGLFRPRDNARRFNATARRMAMPEIPADLFVEAVWTLVDADRDWVPRQTGDSLYLRPFMLATDPFLGVRPSAEYLFAVIASPARAYFAGDGKPISVWVSRDHVRATTGGTGAVKAAVNYAAGLAAQIQAAEAGCDQVLFLDAADRRFVEESNSMNMFFVEVADGRTTLVTPPLTGTILAGITRDSVLRLAERHGWAVAERPCAIDEVRAAARSGLITEAFATGTGVVVSPIGTVRDTEGDFEIGDPHLAGPVTRALKQELLAIQHGQADDPFGWTEVR